MIGDPAKLVIRRKVTRLQAAEIEPFAPRSTSFVVDALQGRGALHHSIKPLDPQSRFIGTALTARAGARDNLAVMAALEHLQPGDVLVIAAQAFEGAAVIGDNVVNIAKARGALAIVTDGMARDASEILEIGLPVFCRGLTPNSAYPSGPGEVGLPVAMGEVTVDSGDLIMGDRDGVVVVPKIRLAEISGRLADVARLEAELHAKIASGVLDSLLKPAVREQIHFLD